MIHDAGTVGAQKLLMPEGRIDVHVKSIHIPKKDSALKRLNPKFESIHRPRTKIFDQCRNDQNVYKYQKGTMYERQKWQRF